MSKNALTMAKDFFEKEAWENAYQICNDYFSDKNDDSWEKLDLNAQEDLAFIKINCIIKNLNLEEVTSGVSEGKMIIWNDKYKELQNSLRQSIIGLAEYFLCDKDDIVKQVIKLSSCFENVTLMIQQHLYSRLDAMINGISNDAGRDGSFGKYMSYWQGVLALFQSTLIFFQELAEIREMVTYNLNMKHFDEAKDVMADKLFERAMAITEEIEEATDDFPYYDYDTGKKVGQMYITAEAITERSSSDTSDREKKVQRLKIRIALICDLLNAVYILEGHKVSLFPDGAERERYYNNVLACEKEIQQVDADYCHPPVDKEAVSLQSNQNSSGGCYVATAVYGSYDCPEVWTLRRYRDDTLASTWYGRLFIRTYYAISPTLVKWFGKTAWFKKIWQDKLDHMVADLQKKGVESTPYEDRKWK